MVVVCYCCKLMCVIGCPGGEVTKILDKMTSQSVISFLFHPPFIHVSAKKMVCVCVRMCAHRDDFVIYLFSRGFSIVAEIV